MKSYKIGVMQGRLLPKYQGRYQAHPVGYWQEEFSLAAKLGLNTIEFIFDFNDANQNPLMHKSGLDLIQHLSAATDVIVETICADYFMEAPIHSHFPSTIKQSQKVLTKLIINASRIGISDIIIPCVDQSSFVNDEAQKIFIENIKLPLEQAEKLGVNLALETDIAPTPFADLLYQLDSSRVTINYDTGNSASLGYDPEEEISCYGNQISSIHIKDRLKEGGSVVLGTGATDFKKFFSAFAKTNYSGSFIMQAYRDNEGLEIFKKQLAWIKPKLEVWSKERNIL